MSAIGAKLKAAREARGLTTSELAASINTLTLVVQNLEDDQFQRLPAPIYVRGFIKLYAQQVGLDPAPLLEEYAAVHARAAGGPHQAAPVAARLKHSRPAPAGCAPEPSLPAAPKPEPPAAPRPKWRFPKFRLPRIGLPAIRIPAEAWQGIGMPAVRIPAEAWQVIGMAAGILALALLLFLGVRETANRRSMAASRDLRLIQEPPAPYLGISTPATPPAGR